MSDLPSTSQTKRATKDNAGSSQQQMIVQNFYDQRQYCMTIQHQNVEQSPHEPSFEETTSKTTDAASATAVVAKPPTVLERHLNTLKKKSKQQASELCGTNERILADRDITIAPLELSTQARESNLVDTLGHYHHRKEITQVFNKPPAQNIDHSQLFHAAKTQAINDAETCTTQEAKERFLLSNSNVVGVVGQAGIGKTTFTKLLVRKILTKNLYDAEFIFYIRLRDVDYKSEMNLLQFLTNNSDFSNNIGEDDLKQILSKLSESNKVCVVCDGFDESSVTGKSKVLKGNCSIYKRVLAETFIKHLLSGNLLSNAKKLFTSRPRQLYHLHESYRPRFIVNIVGLNGEAQMHICKDVCENDAACTKVYKFVNDRPDLKSFCYVPANCILVMYCINVNVQPGNLAALERMDSITTILVAALGLFIKNGHLRDEGFQTKNLACLAYTAFVSRQLFFEQTDLTKADISENQATTFLTTSLGRKAGFKLWEGIVKSKSYFSHLLLHEFFVAIYLILFMKPDSFGKCVSELKKSRYEMVTKFVFGLCNHVTQGYLRELIPSEEHNQTHCKKQKQLLVKLALKQIAAAKNLVDLFQVCSWIYELRDDALRDKAATKLKDKVKISGDKILPSDVPAFQYVLQSRRSPLYLTIDHPDLDGEQRMQFFVALDAILKSSNVKIQELRLRWDTINEDEAVYLASTLQSIMKLGLGTLTEQGFKALSAALKNMSCQMEELYMISAQVSDDNAVLLATCMPNVQKFDAVSCDISARGIKILSEAIKERNSPMEMLCLQNHPFSLSPQSTYEYEFHMNDDAAFDLSTCIHNIRQLDLSITRLSEKGVKSLCDAIEQMKHPMKQLNLQQNRFGNDGAVHLATCVHNVEELVLADCGIGVNGVKVLCHAIKQRKTPMKKLLLNGNEVQNEGTEHLRVCLHNIECIEVKSCRISFRSARSLKSNSSGSKVLWSR